MLTEDNFDVEWTKPKQPLNHFTVRYACGHVLMYVKKKEGGGGG